MQMLLPNPNQAKYSGLLIDIERGRIKIPQFQRDFVWSMQKSAALIDSVLKGYPVGTFIFWNTKDRLRYIRDIGNATLPEARDGELVSFVLDGQQRLTSLYAAFRGLLITRSDGSEDNFQNIYVDLGSNPEEPIVICDVDGRCASSIINLKDLLHGDLTLLASYPNKFHSKISEYRRRLESYDFPIIEVADVPMHIATEIFTRINVGGKSLSLFEIMVAKTYDETRDFDLSREFSELIDRLTPLDYETISDATILQLISLIIMKECKRQSILKLQKAEFIDCWPRVVSAVEEAVEYFRNTYRIPVSQLLPYNTLIAPFAYFFYHQSGKPNTHQKKYLEDFFWRCSLIGRYSSAVESKLSQDIKRIDLIIEDQTPSYDWSVDLSAEFILNNGWFNSGRSFVKAILCLYAYQIPKSFSDNSVVNIKNYWLKRSNSRNYHHFFPRSYLNRIGEEEWKVNNVVNITIVDDWLNKREIGSKSPSSYMKKYVKSNNDIIDTMHSHLIGDLATFGILDNDFESFLAQRSQKISTELRKRIVKRSSDSEGQSIRVDDVEEDPAAAA